MSTSAKSPNIQSVSRAIAILRCFTDSRELGLTEISKQVGLRKSTAAGIINTLKSEKILEQNEDTGKFHLGIDLFLLAVNAKVELKEICEPYLDIILQDTHETVNLGVRYGDSVVYVEKKESPHSMRICTNVGQRLPLYCTAIGKAMMAFLGEEEIERLLSASLKQYTSKTVTDPNQLRQTLSTIRKERVSFDFEELEYGLICVAVPLFNRQGMPIGAISVSGPSMRMNEETRDVIAERLKQVSKEICQVVARAGI